MGKNEEGEQGGVSRDFIRNLPTIIIMNQYVNLKSCIPYDNVALKLKNS